MIQALLERGVGEVVYTNVDRDGMLEGPDLDEVRELACLAGRPPVYSGGIGRLEDLEALAALRPANLAGVIVGKALYEHRFTIPEAKEALAG